jgi:hypothetical protein
MHHGGPSSADLGTIARSALENETTAFTVLEAAHVTHLSTRDCWQLGFGVLRCRPSEGDTAGVSDTGERGCADITRDRAA